MEMISKYDVEIAKSANEKYAPHSPPISGNLCSLILIVLLFGSTSVYLFFRTHHLHNDLQHVTHNSQNPISGHENLKEQLLSSEEALRNSNTTTNQLSVLSSELQHEIDNLKAEMKLHRNATEQKNSSSVAESKSELRELHQLHQNLQNDLQNATRTLQNPIHEVRENVNDHSLSFERKLQYLNATINQVFHYSNQMNMKGDMDLQHEIQALRVETTLFPTVTPPGNYSNVTVESRTESEELHYESHRQAYSTEALISTGESLPEVETEFPTTEQYSSNTGMENPLQKGILPIEQNSSSEAVAEIHPQREYKFCGTWYCLKNCNTGVCAADINTDEIAFTGVSYCITYGSSDAIPDVCPPANERKLLVYNPETKRIETPEKKCLNPLNLLINKETGFGGYTCDMETSMQEFAAVSLS